MLALVVIYGPIALANPRSYPDENLTPGALRTDGMTPAQACAMKWGKDERAVTEKMKVEVYAEYGVIVPRIKKNGKLIYVFPHINGKPAYEVDHRISRELRGADVTANLGLQSYFGDCNAHDKDRLENRLHAEACQNPSEASFASVVAEVKNWVPAYEKRWGTCVHDQ